MRAVLASLVATGSLLALLAPTAAAPPGDVAAYCRATYPQVQFQVRCLDVEHAAAARVSRASVGANPDIFNRCLGSTTSWVTMEACLAQAARIADPTGTMTRTSVPGLGPNLGGSPDPAGGTADPLRGAALVPTLAPAAGSADALTPSSLLGPRPGMPLSAPIQRPSIPIPEADADRQLRAVLERTGISATQCTKTQYGPGWVTICRDPRPVEHRRPVAPPPPVTPPAPPGDDRPALPGLEDHLGL